MAGFVQKIRLSEFLGQLETIGFSKLIKTIQPAYGPYVIEIDGREITIGRGLFNKIILEKEIYENK